MKNIVLGLLILVLLVSCAPNMDEGIRDWDNLGDGLYRKIDRQLGIVCYYALTSMENGVAFSCVNYDK